MDVAMKMIQSRCLGHLLDRDVNLDGPKVEHLELLQMQLSLGWWAMPLMVEILFQRNR